MNHIKIITDSTAYIAKNKALEEDIKVVPLSVTFEGETKDEGYPGEFEGFYNKLKNAETFPVTSQPSIGAFKAAYEEALNEKAEVIVIVLSSKLSGTFNSATTAAELTAPDKITVIDSETTVANLKVLVEMAIHLVKNGKTRQEIVAIINEQKERMGIYLTVGTLEYLKRGGRLTSTQALVGSLLNIKPIIGLVDGALIAIDKVRGKNNAIQKMVFEIPKNVKTINICHILNNAEAEKLKKILQEKFYNVEIGIEELGPVIGSHLGPKAFGVCYLW